MSRMLLSAALAGVRDIRAPLAGGLLWLVSVYLALGSNAPTRERAEGAIADIYALLDACPPGALIATIGFVAYLVGATSQDLVEVLVKRVTRLALRLSRALQVAGASLDKRSERRRAWRHSVTKCNDMSRALAAWAGSNDAALSLEGKDAAGEICERTIRNIERVLSRGRVTSHQIDAAIPTERALVATYPPAMLVDIAEAFEARRQHSGAIREDHEGEVQEEVIRDLETTKLRLLTAEPELHAAIDRVEAESAIRLAIVPPLLALTVVLTFRNSMWWLAATPTFAMFWHQGIQRRKKRGDLIVDALDLELVTAPFLQRLLSAANDAVADAEERTSDKAQST